MNQWLLGILFSAIVVPSELLIIVLRDGFLLWPFLFTLAIGLPSGAILGRYMVIPMLRVAWELIKPVKRETQE